MDVREDRGGIDQIWVSGKEEWMIEWLKEKWLALRLFVKFMLDEKFYEETMNDYGEEITKLNEACDDDCGFCNSYFEEEDPNA